MIARHGTGEQKDYFLPRMAAGDIRAPSPCPNPAWAPRRGHPHPGQRDGEDFVLNGQKMWPTAAAAANLVAALSRPMTGTRPRTGT